MNPSELFKKDRAILKDLPLKEKVKHIWHYYKWYFGALLLVIVYIASTIASYISTSNCVLNGIFLNSTADASTFNEMSDTFLATAEQTKEDATVFVDTLSFSANPSAEDATSMYETFQTLLAKAHAGDLDFLVTGSDSINQLIYNEFFLDLSSLLDPEQLSAYQDKLLYMDRSFLEHIQNLDASSALDTPIAYPDPTDPASMKDPVPVLVDIRTSRWFSDLYPGVNDLYAYGLVTNGTNTQTAISFLEYLMNLEK